MRILSLLIPILLIVLTMAITLEPFRLKEFANSARFFAINLCRLIAGPILADQRGLLFQRINRSSPEKVFAAVKNNYSTAAITVGQAVQWDFTGAADGVGVTRPTARATNAGMATAGAVAEATVASAGYGLIQIYGYNSALRVRNVTGGSPAMAAGSPLIINAAGSVFCFENMSTASKVIQRWPCGFAITASTGWTTAARAGFLKCM